MRSVDLDGIEQALGIKLPVAYRAAATEGRLEGLLNSDAGSVVAITHAFRNGDFGDRDWPATLFAFADDGANSLLSERATGKLNAKSSFRPM